MLQPVTGDDDRPPDQTDHTHELRGDGHPGIHEPLGVTIQDSRVTDAAVDDTNDVFFGTTHVHDPTLGSQHQREEVGSQSSHASAFNIDDHDSSNDDDDAQAPPPVSLDSATGPALLGTSDQSSTRAVTDEYKKDVLRQLNQSTLNARQLDLVQNLIRLIHETRNVESVSAAIRKKDGFSTVLEERTRADLGQEWYRGRGSFPPPRIDHHQ